MKELLIIIHGMGNHTPESFEKEVVNACNNALQRYDSYKNEKFESKVHIESIGYDDIFEKRRLEYQQSGQTLTDFITAGYAGGALPGFVSELAEIESGLGDDKFVYTHILDVIFYLSLIGERVRLRVATKIIEAIKKYPAGTRINILAHSLGTAVVHDTLHKLYTKGFIDENGKSVRLDKNTLKINNYWTIANVSPIICKLNGLTGPEDSVVKPGAGGAVFAFQNIFHEFDPFTLEFINRFEPESGTWISDSDFDLFYKRYRTEKVARKNTHSIGGYIDAKETGGYLEDPLICHDFIRCFMEFNPSAAEKTKGDEKYKNSQDEARKIKDFVDTLKDLNGLSDLKKLVKMLKEFRSYLEGMDF